MRLEGGGGAETETAHVGLNRTKASGICVRLINGIHCGCEGERRAVGAYGAPGVSIFCNLPIIGQVRRNSMVKGHGRLRGK